MNPNFFVYIIESPAPEDLLDGRTEGQALASVLTLAQIPCFYHLAVNETQFGIALNARFNEVFDAIALPPIIHISAHGNDNGIQLTDQRERQELIQWTNLATSLGGIRTRAGQFGLCMSTCGGANAMQMARVIREDDVPFLWVAGSSSSVSYIDAALAYSVFYRGLQKGANQAELVEMTRAATGLSDFTVEFGSIIRQQYTREIVEKLRTKVPNFSQWLANRQSQIGS